MLRWLLLGPGNEQSICNIEFGALGPQVEAITGFGPVLHLMPLVWAIPTSLQWLISTRRISPARDLAPSTLNNTSVEASKAHPPAWKHALDMVNWSESKLKDLLSFLP